LFQYIKLLEIDVPKKNENNYTINFKWHDPEEAMKILKDTLNLTSNNLKIAINNELKEILEFEKQFKLNTDQIRLDYLKEQAAIAKELNIVDNQIDNVNLSQSNVSLSINTTNIAYYLRGYKAIDKEIELIETRTYTNLKFIEQIINNIINMEFNYVDYNIYLMETKSLKDTKLTLMISILLGLIIGVFFVHISNVFQSQTASKKTR
jgi:LPS O-antigen subunit length determinant protein (WzzB/FepE family)